MTKTTESQNLMDIIGHNIKLLRNAQMMTIDTLSKGSGVSVSMISSIENKRASNVSIVTLNAIAQTLSTDIATLTKSFYTNEDDDTEETTYYDILDIIEHDAMLKTFYPPVFRKYTISSLLEFLIVLPLLDLNVLYEKLSRIDGDIYRREEYISIQLSSLWEAVPDSPEKKYATSVLKSIREIRQSRDVLSAYDYKEGGENHQLYMDHIHTMHQLIYNIEIIANNICLLHKKPISNKKI